MVPYIRTPACLNGEGDRPQVVTRYACTRVRLPVTSVGGGGECSFGGEGGGGCVVIRLFAAAASGEPIHAHAALRRRTSCARTASGLTCLALVFL